MDVNSRRGEKKKEKAIPINSRYAKIEKEANKATKKEVKPVAKDTNKTRRKMIKPTKEGDKIAKKGAPTGKKMKEAGIGRMKQRGHDCSY